MYRILHILLLLGVSAMPLLSMAQSGSARDTTRTDSIPPYVSTTRPPYNLPYRYSDPFTSRFGRSALFLQDPTKLQLDISYDSGFNYTLYERIGNLNFRPATSFSFDAYDQLNTQNITRDYFRERSAGLDGESAVSGRRLIPKLYISPIFDRIFGGSYVDIVPTGFVNLDFGGNWQTVENPAIPIRQQRNGGFNFEQQISLNLVGKVGDKLQISANFDNNNTFDFQNNMKIEYTGYDEDIVKKIEIGNVNMPVANSLMTGSQTLFGLKTELQFGKLYFTGVASRQQGQRRTATLSGTTNPQYGGELQPQNSIRASEYENDKHFFLGHFFRDHFEEWMQDPQNIISGVQIVNIEVYVTNRDQNTQNTLNTVALLDLGETSRSFNPTYLTGQNRPTDNVNNPLYQSLINLGNRRSDDIINLLEGNLGLQNGKEFVATRITKQLERGTEFIVNEKLGYITLLTNLFDNQSLAVAFQYSYNGQIYTVGELSAEQRVGDDESIFLKMLRPANIDIDLPTWDLMMKNIYNLNATRIEKAGFELRVHYKDDLTNFDNPSLNEGQQTKDIPLVEIFGADQYNPNGDPGRDGIFDFVPDVTINTERGYIIFPVLEPFGATLLSRFDPDTEAELIERYVYDQLYSTTKGIALRDSERDKYVIYYRARGGAGGYQNNEIQIDAFQVTPGSITVRLGTTTLVEGRDYTVGFGKITITNPNYLPNIDQIQVEYETPNLFNFQTTWFYGGRLDYQVDDNFNVGATILHINERRGGITRFTVGNEPLRNTKYGFDISLQKDASFLTKAVDALPLVSTKEPSQLTFTAEYARFIPGTSNDIDGDPTSYIEDFETAATPTNLGGFQSWKLAATPKTTTNQFFGDSDSVDFNFKKAKIAWYTIDNSVFYRTGGNRPENITEDDLQNHYVRPVLPQEIFKQRDRTQVNLNEPLFEIAYFPSERGQQNFNPSLDANGLLLNPETNWGGITRPILNETDFITSNFQYIEFWLLDPFINSPRGVVQDGIFNEVNSTGGELVFNLGSISEDLVPDNVHFFENGLPEDGPATAISSSGLGRIPSTEFLTRFFVNSATARENQDIGFDGVKNEDEAQFFASYLNSLSGPARAAVLEDVSADNFQYYLGSSLDAENAKIVERYKNFNGTEGNSPFTAGETFTPANSTLPDIEDVNNDNSVSSVESYFEYRIPLYPGGNRTVDPSGTLLDEEFIVDKVVDESGEATWYQFRIPINRFTDIYGTPNFQNVQYMRMYLTGWSQPVVLRMAKFQLVRSFWVKYDRPLRDPGLNELPDPDLDDFDVSVVNVEENSTGNENQPPYVVPPGLNRDIDNSTTLNRRFNEQALQLCVQNLADNDARAAFKTQVYNLINYDQIEMFLHVHSFDASTTLNDGDVNGFVRFSTDQSQNYYEIEVPLTVTAQGLDPNQSDIRELVWPADNRIIVNISDLRALKVQRDRNNLDPTLPFIGTLSVPGSPSKTYRVTVVGNPDLTSVQSLMIGIRNPEGGDGLAKSACLWANELRATGYNIQSGWAANASVEAKMANLATFRANTQYTSIGFGALDASINERSLVERFAYNMNLNLNLEQFMFPQKTGLVVPVFASYERSRVTPQYDPLNKDVLLDQTLETFLDEDEREEYKRIVEDRTVRRSFNLSNVRKQKTNPEGKKRFFDISNFSFSYAFRDELSSSVYRETFFSKNVSGGVNYTYQPPAISWQPFNEIFKSPYLQLFRDINFSPFPSNVSFSANLNRNFTRTQLYNSDLTTEGIDPYIERNFTFNRLYQFRWSVFKSLAIDYTARANAVIDEEGFIDGDVNTQAERQYIWEEIFSLGRMKTFDQTFTFNYRTPLDKLPFTNWVSLDLRYVAGYTWTAGPLPIGQALQFDSLRFGNYAANRRDRSATSRIDMVKLYNKVKFLQAANNASDRERTTGQSILKTLMMLRSINVTYNIRESTTLPGFLPEAYAMGLDNNLDAPGFDFIFGSQDNDIRFRAAKNGWLSYNPALSAPFEQTKGTDLAIRSTLEPFKNLSIQVDFIKQNTNGYQELFRYDTATTVQDFRSFTPARTGSYNISFLSIRTSFEKQGDDNFSDAFNEFENNLNIIYQRLDAENPSPGSYDSLSQDVLIPAFIAAYSGQSAGDVKLNPFPRIPLPNWRIDYTGLSKIPGLSNIFQSFTISHGYRSVYAVGNFSNSLRYDDNLTLNNELINYPLASDTNNLGQLVPVYIVNQVMISEQFAPLFGINFRTKSNISTRLEFKKERNLSLNMANAQITETTNNDVTLDFGLTKDQFKIPFRFSGRTVVLPNDVRINVSFTIRDSKTIQRKVGGESIVTNGSLNYQIRPTLTYNINRQLDFTMYFERTVTEPRLLSSFRRATTAFGFQLRFNLAQ